MGSMSPSVVTPDTTVTITCAYIIHAKKSIKIFPPWRTEMKNKDRCVYRRKNGTCTNAGQCKGYNAPVCSNTLGVISVTFKFVPSEISQSIMGNWTCQATDQTKHYHVNWQGLCILYFYVYVILHSSDICCAYLKRITN